MSAPNQCTVPTPMQKALATPIRMAARNAPPMLPSPPTTVTTKASAMTARSRSRLAGSRGICSAPPRPGQHGADEEHRGEELGLVDAQRAHHLAVLGGGPHQRAPARARQQQPHRAQHDRADGDQQQVVGRDAAAQDLDRHGEAGRARTDQVLGAPGEQRDVLDHQHDGEGREQLEQFGRLVDAAQHQHLDQHADQADRERRQHDRAPEAEGRAAQRLDQAVGAVEAQHVERAVREVDDPRHAEDQRQAGRHQEQRRRGGQPVQELDDDARRRSRHVTLSPRAQRGDLLWPRDRSLAALGMTTACVNWPASSS